MSNAASQLADGIELLRLAQTRLGRPMLVNLRSVPSPGEKLVREILRGPRIFVRAEVRIAPSFCLARRSAPGSIPAVCGRESDFRLRLSGSTCLYRRTSAHRP